MALEDIRIFSLDCGEEYASRVASRLGLALSEHEERDFEDGEHKVRPLVNVRRRHVFVVQSLHGDTALSANDKLCRLLFFIGALKDASASSVTVVAPYLCYARKDRKTKSRDPVTTRYVAQIFEAVGIDRMVTLDVHNLAAYQNAFRCRTDHLEATLLFVEHFAPACSREDFVVVSPDIGGVKRAEHFRGLLSARSGRDITIGFMEKKRSGGVVTGDVLSADVEGRTVIVFDDLISSGTTMQRTAIACKDAGAHRVYAVATHGLFVRDAPEVFAHHSIDQVVVTDVVPPFRLPTALVEEKVTVLDATPLLAGAIERISTGGSIVALLEG